MDITASIKARIPNTLLPVDTVLGDLITKWKLFLCILVSPSIPENTAMDDTAWGRLETELIINLVLFDSINLTYNKYLMAQGGGASTSEGSNGAVKKIVTGPAEAEFFGMSDTISEIMKPGGLFEAIKDAICMLAERLDIKLYICRRLENTKVIAPKTYHTHNSSHHR